MNTNREEENIVIGYKNVKNVSRTDCDRAGFDGGGGCVNVYRAKFGIEANFLFLFFSSVSVHRTDLSICLRTPLIVSLAILHTFSATARKFSKLLALSTTRTSLRDAISLGEHFLIFLFHFFAVVP